MNVAWHRAHRLPAGASRQVRLAWHRAHETVCQCRPMPPALDRLDLEEARARLRGWLDGRDARSLAHSAEAQAFVRERPARMAALGALARHPNWAVAMRALDLLEKFAASNPSWVQPHRAVFLAAATSEQWLIRLQVVRALPRLAWRPAERAAVLAILTRGVHDPQTFVRAWSLDGLATFAASQPRLMRRVRRLVSAFERSDRPALRARARHIRARLEGGRPARRGQRRRF